MPAPGLTIRPARVDDARDIARLFLVSSDGLAAYIWSRLTQPGQKLEDVGAARYARSGVAFSYENCLIAERAGAAVGMAHAFPMEPRAPGDVEDDPVLRPYAELEDPGSLYVSGLAVNEGERGRGIGGALMERVADVARARGLPRLSLICFERNQGAMRFYLSRSFREIARRPLVPHPSLHYADGDAILLVADLR